MSVTIGKAKLSRTVQTVGDLIAVLIGLPPETRIQQDWTNGVTVTQWEDESSDDQWVDFEGVEEDDDDWEEGDDDWDDED